MQRLIVSMMRFSTAMTLYGYEQLRSSVELVRGEEALNQTMSRLRATIDSLSDVLVDGLGGGNRETLKSITNTAGDVVKRSFEGIRLVDPREMAKAATDLIKRSSDALAGRIDKMTSTEGGEPVPAAEALS